MSGHYAVLNPKAFDADSLFKEQFALDVLMGLSTERKFLPSKYFYDEEGSSLFQRIMDLEEYYPTRCEFEIFQARKGEIARRLEGAPFSCVELGAGDGRKTKVLLRRFREAGLAFRYVPIDISESAVAGLTEDLRREFPGIECRGIVAEYFDALRWLNRNDAQRKLVLFLGSNIGNFDAPRARVFLRTLWNALNGGDWALIGFDLKKDIDVLLRAYNDPAGVTDAFNLNVLTRINRELGADFDVRRFQHFGTYNVFSGAMESYLVSLERQTVQVAALNKSFDFRPFEPIHLEYSYKYLPEDIEALARETGFRVEATFRDSRGYFADSLWRVVKS